MKKNNRAAALAVMSVLLSLTLNACVIKQEQPPEPTTDPASATTTQTEETTTTAEVTETTVAETEPSVSESSPVELEGQPDYMMLRSDYDGVVDAREGMITDASVFEDEELRDLAQSYLDQGYMLLDEGGQLDAFGTLGDDEYMFCQGFLAYTNGDAGESTIWVYRMNETLFDYYLVEQNGFTDEECQDDGNVIIYGSFDSDSFLVTEAQFDRETGIGTYSLVYDFSDYHDFETTDIDSIENDDLRAAVQEYADRGFYMFNYNLDTFFGEEVEDKVGELHGYGVRAFWQDSDNNVEYYVFLCNGDEDLVDALVTSGRFMDEYRREETEEGITINTAGYSFDGYSEYTIEYYYDTDLIVITMVVGYSPNISVVLSHAGYQSSFDSLVEMYEADYGAEIDREDDGAITRVYFYDEENNETEMIEYDRHREWITIYVIREE